MWWIHHFSFHNQSSHFILTNKYNKGCVQADECSGLQPHTRGKHLMSIKMSICHLYGRWWAAQTTLVLRSWRRYCHVWAVEWFPWTRFGISAPSDGPAMGHGAPVGTPSPWSPASDTCCHPSNSTAQLFLLWEGHYIGDKVCKIEVIFKVKKGHMPNVFNIQIWKLNCSAS